MTLALSVTLGCLRSTKWIFRHPNEVSRDTPDLILLRRKEGKKQGSKEARKQLGRKEGRKKGRKRRLKKGKIRTAITTDSK